MAALMEDVVEVTQADRDVAHEIMQIVRGYRVNLPNDRHWLIDIVARHRLAHSEPRPVAESDWRGWVQAIGAEIERQCFIGAGGCNTADDGSGLFEVRASLDLNGFAQAMIAFADTHSPAPTEAAPTPDAAASEAGDSLATAKARLSIATVKAHNSGAAKVNVIADDVAVLIAAHSDQDRVTVPSEAGIFGAAMFQVLWDQFTDDGYEIEIHDLITVMAVEAGLVTVTKFDPETHNDASGAAEPGDAFYEVSPAGRAALRAALTTQGGAEG